MATPRKTTAPRSKAKKSKADDAACCGPGYASPQEAMQADREKLLYTIGIYTGTGIEAPDYLATIDCNPRSKNYSKVIHRLEMPGIGDELHHMGWNACSSCHGDADMSRQFLILPGVRTTNLHIVDTATNPKAPKLHMIVSGDEIKEKTNLSAPHTVHCLGSDIIISMLGDADGNGPGGFLHLDKDFNIVGRWENDLGDMKYNYDFWYQPRHNTMVSSEWGSPNTFMPGFDLGDVAKGKYGQQIHFWNFKKKKVKETVDLGAEGMIPLEVRYLHDPESSHGFVGATLSSNMFHFYKKGKKNVIEKVIDIPPVDVIDFPVPMPSLITDFLISMDDQWLYLCNWLHGDVRQYNISDPSAPKFTGQVWMGGLLGRAPEVNGHRIEGGPQMIQCSLDGKRLYVTTSLFSTWDNQFYPAMKEVGGCMVMLDADTEKGGLSINKRFFVDFKDEPKGPARAHETRYPGGDCTSDIWI
ncbi:selenium-binding family protein [Rhodobacteraceae bacterium NNCM2]|nr:selenium-binding family protein [Coraliihabitans acroporae]